MLEKYREVSSSIHKWGQSLGQIDSELPSGPYNCHHTPFSTRPHCGDVEEPKDGTTGRRLLAAQKDWKRNGSFFIRLYYLYHEDLVSLLHFEVGDKYDKLMPSKIFPSKTAAEVQESSMQEVRHQRPTLLPGWPTHLAWLVLWLCFNFVSINGPMACSACKLMSYVLADISNSRHIL